MKIVEKFWKIALSLVLIIILGIYVLFFAIKSVRNYEIYSKPNLETKIYTIWHIETFEGGGKSRLTYLKNLASSIEKDNAEILFHISTINPEKLGETLKNSTPDIVSFGFGVGKILLPHLVVQDSSYSVRDNLFESGTFTNKLYAIPYIVGGYAHFSHNANNTETIFGLNNFVAPSNTQNLIGYPSQYEAYKKFANDKKVNLIGTTRDLFRINNLNEIGRTNATITPLEDYTNLIQYIAATKKDEIIELFISSLMSTSYQAKLTEYSLFSSLNTKIYSQGIYSDMENALFKASVPKVF